MMSTCSGWTQRTLPQEGRALIAVHARPLRASRPMSRPPTRVRTSPTPIFALARSDLQSLASPPLHQVLPPRLPPGHRHRRRRPRAAQARPLRLALACARQILQLPTPPVSRSASLDAPPSSPPPRSHLPWAVLTPLPSRACHGAPAQPRAAAPTAGNARVTPTARSHSAPLSRRSRRRS